MDELEAALAVAEAAKAAAEEEVNRAKNGQAPPIMIPNLNLTEFKSSLCILHSSRGLICFSNAATSCTSVIDI